MVYTSGAVSIEHESVARVFYSKQKPRVIRLVEYESLDIEITLLDAPCHLQQLIWSWSSLYCK